MAGTTARVHARHSKEATDQEDATASALALLPHDTWTVLNDVVWPDRARVHVDHVVIGPGGIFAFHTESSQDEPARRGELWPDARRRTGMLASAGSAAAAVAAVTPPSARRLARPVLCFVGCQGVVGTAEGVELCSTENVVEMLLRQPVVLDAAVIDSVLEELWEFVPARIGDRPPVPETAVVRLAARQPRWLRRSERVAGHLGGYALAVIAALLVTDAGWFTDLLG